VGARSSTRQIGYNCLIFFAYPTFLPSFAGLFKLHE
jgi:hypothetical protein